MKDFRPNLLPANGEVNKVPNASRYTNVFRSKNLGKGYLCYSISRQCSDDRSVCQSFAQDCECQYDPWKGWKFSLPEMKEPLSIPGTSGSNERSQAKDTQMKSSMPPPRMTLRETKRKRRPFSPERRAVQEEVVPYSPGKEMGLGRHCTCFVEGRLCLDNLGISQFISEAQQTQPSQDLSNWNALSIPPETRGISCFLDGSQSSFNLIYCLVAEPMMPRFHEEFLDNHQKYGSAHNGPNSQQRESIPLIEGRPLFTVGKHASAEEAENSEEVTAGEEEDLDTSATTLAQLNTALSEETKVKKVLNKDEESEQVSNEEIEAELTLDKRVPQGICKMQYGKGSMIIFKCFDGSLRCSDGECLQIGFPCTCEYDAHNEAFMRIRQELADKAQAMKRTEARARRKRNRQNRYHRPAVTDQPARPIGICKYGGGRYSGYNRNRLRRLECFYQSFTCSSRPCHFLNLDCECEYNPLLKSMH